MNRVKIIFLIYSIILVFCILFKFNLTIDDIKNEIFEFRSSDYKKVNLVFFNTIKTQLTLLNKWALINLAANTAPFSFYGFLFFYSFKLSFLKTFIINTIFILIIELLQLSFVIGSFDIDDLFLNVLFIMIGFIIANKVYKTPDI